MLNPETIKFPAPDTQIFVSEHRWDVASDVKNIEAMGRQLHFCTRVSLILPDTISVPEKVSHSLTRDCEYYCVQNLPLTEFCKMEFIQAFIERGKLFAFSCNSRLDLDPSIAVTPDGVLHLTLEKVTYQQLGLVGKLSAHILRTPKEWFVVKIDTLRKNFHPGTGFYDRTMECVTRVSLCSNFWIRWIPNDETVCPSSIARYFQTRSYEVAVVPVSLSTRMLRDISLPAVITENLEEDARNFLDWIGAAMMDLPFLNNDILSESTSQGDQMDKALTLICDGFFPPSQVECIISSVRLWLDQRSVTSVPFVIVCAYSHPDAPLTWGPSQHSIQSSWSDNWIALVVTRDKAVRYACRGSQKPQRHRVKSSNR